MAKGKRNKSRHRNSVEAKPTDAAEPQDEEKIIGEPPRKNLPMLILAGGAFGLWLLYLIYLASQS